MKEMPGCVMDVATPQCHHVNIITAGESGPNNVQQAAVPVQQHPLMWMAGSTGCNTILLLAMEQTLVYAADFMCIGSTMSTIRS